jgi:glycosyltransferase involved in cell wall biosynthesis
MSKNIDFKPGSPVRITHQNWPKGVTPWVSIVNNTYNQEKFIIDALESFLMQETTFPVEILVHDDASTDRTAEIVKEYELKYPGLVLPIYQKENQYSKNVKPTQNFQIPRARGKYIAICEGDDYWTDPLKLQKQVELMERHPPASLCVSLNEQLVKNTKEIKRDKPYYGIDYPMITKLEDLNQYFHTSTYLIRKSIYSSLANKYPNLIMGDTSLRYLLISKGPFVVLNDYVSVYRITGEGIWTRLSDFEKEVSHYKIFHTFRTHFVPEQFKYHLINEMASLKNLLVHFKKKRMIKEWFIHSIKYLYLKIRYKYLMDFSKIKSQYLNRLKPAQ